MAQRGTRRQEAATLELSRCDKKEGSVRSQMFIDREYHNFDYEITRLL
jgi:hypothetical protein